MGGGWSDLRTSARNLARRPALAIGVTLTIGLGIGATTTIYSVVDGVILRPLPFQDPSRLVAIGGVASGDGFFDPETGLQELVPMSSSVYAGFRERARAVDEVAAITPSRIVLSDADGLQEQVGAARVSPEFLQMLGASPVLGRAFLPEEHSIPAAPVAMITYETGRDATGATPTSSAGRSSPRSPPKRHAPRSWGSSLEASCRPIHSSTQTSRRRSISPCRSRRRARTCACSSRFTRWVGSLRRRRSSRRGPRPWELPLSSSASSTTRSCGRGRPGSASA